MADSNLLRVVTPAELGEKERQAAIPVDDKSPEFTSELARYISNGFEWARQHRTVIGLENQLLDAMRTYTGKYSAEKLSEIKKFGGSEVYARMTTVKCRGASSLLRDIYLSGDRPWTLDPTPEPKVPNHISGAIDQLVGVEVQTLQQGGQPIDQAQVEARRQMLQDAARKAEKQQAKVEADKAADVLDDFLFEGKFYDALRDLILDLPIFPYACIKGPVVRNHTEFEWQPDGSRKATTKPKRFWDRVSPFDLFFSPGASSVERASIYEHMRLMRAELADLIGVPGYNEEMIEQVLAIDTPRLKIWQSFFETERALMERREDPYFAQENLFIDALEFNGFVDGKMLLQWGLTAKDVPDENVQYYTTAWLIDRYVIKAQVNPSPRGVPLYYITAFEKLPGSLTGNGLPEILSDIQDVSNATLRALVNNLSIASGPQVIIDDTRVAPMTDSDSLYPWKRWHTVNDPMNNATKPVDFYQPNSNSAELLGVYKEFSNMADETSAIPRYLTGSQRTGGAAATASGLAMLMNNAGKIMQNVAANIDSDILTPAISNLYDNVMLTEVGLLRGDEVIVVKGATTAMQREQDRVRQLEFLNITANPLDAQIVGPKARAVLLRAISKNLGLDYGYDLVADDADIQRQIEQQQAQAAQPEGTTTPQQGQTPAPQAGRSDAAPPRMNLVSNQSTS